MTTTIERQLENLSGMGRLLFFRRRRTCFVAVLIVVCSFFVCVSYLSSEEDAAEVVPVEKEEPNSGADEDIRIISRTRTAERSRAQSTRTRFFTKRKVFSKDNDPSSRSNAGLRGGGNPAEGNSDSVHRRVSSRAETFPSVQPQPSIKEVPFGFEMSPWGGFKPGSWRRTRTTATTLDGTKSMKSITETKTTFLRIENNSIVLKQEKTIKMGALNHVTPPEEIRLDFFGAPIQEGQTQQELQPSSVVIARKVIPCLLCRIEKLGDRRQDSTVVWYSSSVAPYLLQKEARSYELDAADPSKRNLVSFSQTTISRTSAHLLIGNAFATYRSETTTQKGGYNSRTTVLHSLRIPGHIIKETTSEKDTAGKILYQSETILLDYFAEKN